MRPSRRPASRRTRTSQSAAPAHERAKDLGPLLPVEPGSTGPAGEPELALGQVYATRTGEAFHTTWCGTVDGVWYGSKRPDRLYVIDESTVGRRRLCQTCSGGL